MVYLFVKIERAIYMSKIAAKYTIYSHFGALMGVYFWNQGYPTATEGHTEVRRSKDPID